MHILISLWNKVGNNINSELSLGHLTLCRIWHLLAFRLGKQLSESLTSVLSCLLIICILSLLHLSTSNKNPASARVFSNISCFSHSLGSPLCNQSSLLIISHATPAVTLGQLSSDFYRHVRATFHFLDPPVLPYTPLSAFSCSTLVLWRCNQLPCDCCHVQCKTIIKSYITF